MFAFLESLGQWNLSGQPFFLNFESRDPFLGKGAETCRILAWWRFLCETFVTHVQKGYEAVEYVAIFSVFENIEN